MKMHIELQATCSALGYQEGDQYLKEPDCLEAVKDLIRFLKREDDDCEIRRQLGYAEILQQDLIPIIKCYKKDRNLIEAVIRLMVNLTQPAILCFGNQIPQEKTLRNYYLEIESYLQSYKEAFADEELFCILTELLGDLLKRDWEHRQEEDRLFIERILITIRNILHVPPNPASEKRTDDDASIHDQVLWSLHVSGMEDLMLYIGNSEEERHLCFHILEIISLMFREQTPELLACAGVQRSMTEKERDERELELMREQERIKKKLSTMKCSSRHSRFGGTFTVQNMKSISNRDVIFHRSLRDMTDISLDMNKKPKKKPKNRQPIKDEQVIRRSTLSIRLSMKEFCIQFLENCYNPLMRAVKDKLNRELSQENDETYYLWSMRFFMEFSRLHNKRIDLISETLSIPSFHYIQMNMYKCYEMIIMEKKEAQIWGKRVHLALKAYQELLMSLDAMDKDKDPQIKESARVIKSNIFYQMEFRDIFITLLKKFDESKQSRTYLKDLIETTHLFLKMLGTFCKKTKHLVVQTKKKKTRRKKVNKKGPTVGPPEFSTQELEDMWDDVAGDLSALFQGREDIPDDVTPFDAASEVEEDQQRVDAMIRIQDTLRDKKAGEAVALFRAAREIWPERNEFGAQDISAEEEFMALREIFLTNLPRPAAPEQMENTEEFGEEQNEAVEEEMGTVEVAEQEFEFKKFIIRFAKSEILKNYRLLLANFEKNSEYTNHCIIKMFHRVAVDLSMPGMLFQISIFRVFQKLLSNLFIKSTRYQEMVKFSKYIINKFTEIAEKEKLVFMELLFWKTSKEAMEIMDGYGTGGASSNAKMLWTEDQEMEVRRLFEEFQDIEGGDIGDLIMERITDSTKTRFNVIKELKRQNLITSAKDLKRHHKTSVGRGPWREEEEEELKDWFDMFKDSNDPLTHILNSLTVKRSKQRVVEKILELGLVSDRKALYKKRSRKDKQKSCDESDEDDNRRWEKSDDEVIDNDSESEEDVSEYTSDASDEETGNNQSPKEDHAPTDSGMASSLKNLIDKGYHDQIKWIQRGVSRTVEGRESGEEAVAVPIVPLTEENETAMEDEVFLTVLRKIGMKEPADEQEAFWRIPAELSLIDLKNIVNGLEIGEDGEAVDAHKIETFDVNKKQKKHKNKEDKKRRKEEKTKRKKEEKAKRKKDKEQAASKREKKMKALKELKKKIDSKKIEKKQRRRKRSPSPDTEDSISTSLMGRETTTEENVTMNGMDSSEPEIGEVNGDVKHNEIPSRKRNRRGRIKIMDDSDDSGDDRLKIAEDCNDSDDEPLNKKRPKLLLESDEEEESQSLKQPSESFPATLFTQPASDSDDSDMDDNIPLRAIVHNNRIESDEDD